MMRAIAIFVLVAFSAETCLWAAPQDRTAYTRKDCALRPVRLIEQDGGQAVLSDTMASQPPEAAAAAVPSARAVFTQSVWASLCSIRDARLGGIPGPNSTAIMFKKDPKTREQTYFVLVNQANPVIQTKDTLVSTITPRLWAFMQSPDTKCASYAFGINLDDSALRNEIIALHQEIVKITDALSEKKNVEACLGGYLELLIKIDQLCNYEAIDGRLEGLRGEFGADVVERVRGQIEKITEEELELVDCINTQELSVRLREENPTPEEFRLATQPILDHLSQEPSRPQACQQLIGHILNERERVAAAAGITKKEAYEYFGELLAVAHTVFRDNAHFSSLECEIAKRLFWDVQMLTTRDSLGVLRIPSAADLSDVDIKATATSIISQAAVQPSASEEDFISFARAISRPVVWRLRRLLELKATLSTEKIVKENRVVLAEKGEPVAKEPVTESLVRAQQLSPPGSPLRSLEASLFRENLWPLSFCGWLSIGASENEANFMPAGGVEWMGHVEPYIEDARDFLKGGSKGTEFAAVSNSIGFCVPALEAVEGYLVSQKKLEGIAQDRPYYLAAKTDDELKLFTFVPGDRSVVYTRFKHAAELCDKYNSQREYVIKTTDAAVQYMFEIYKAWQKNGCKTANWPDGIQEEFKVILAPAKRALEAFSDISNRSHPEVAIRINTALLSECFPEIVYRTLLKEYQDEAMAKKAKEALSKEALRLLKTEFVEGTEGRFKACQNRLFSTAIFIVSQAICDMELVQKGVLVSVPLEYEVRSDAQEALSRVETRPEKYQGLAGLDFSEPEFASFAPLDSFPDSVVLADTACADLESAIDRHIRRDIRGAMIGIKAGGKFVLIGSGLAGPIEKYLLNPYAPDIVVMLPEFERGAGTAWATFISQDAVEEALDTLGLVELHNCNWKQGYAAMQQTGEGGDILEAISDTVEEAEAVYDGNIELAYQRLQAARERLVAGGLPQGVELPVLENALHRAILLYARISDRYLSEFYNLYNTAPLVDITGIVRKGLDEISSRVSEATGMERTRQAIAECNKMLDAGKVASFADWQSLRDTQLRKAIDADISDIRRTIEERLGHMTPQEAVAVYKDLKARADKERGGRLITEDTMAEYSFALLEMVRKAFVLRSAGVGTRPDVASGRDQATAAKTDMVALISGDEQRFKNDLLKRVVGLCDALVTSTDLIFDKTNSEIQQARFQDISGIRQAAGAARQKVTLLNGPQRFEGDFASLSGYLQVSDSVAYKDVHDIYDAICQNTRVAGYRSVAYECLMEEFSGLNLPEEEKRLVAARAIRNLWTAENLWLSLAQMGSSLDAARGFVSQAQAAVGQAPEAVKGFSQGLFFDVDYFIDRRIEASVEDDLGDNQVRLTGIGPFYEAKVVSPKPAGQQPKQALLDYILPAGKPDDKPADIAQRRETDIAHIEFQVEAELFGLGCPAGDGRMQILLPDRNCFSRDAFLNIEPFIKQLLPAKYISALGYNPYQNMPTLKGLRNYYNCLRSLVMSKGKDAAPMAYVCFGPDGSASASPGYSAWAFNPGRTVDEIKTKLSELDSFVLPIMGMDDDTRQLHNKPQDEIVQAIVQAYVGKFKELIKPICDEDIEAAAPGPDRQAFERMQSDAIDIFTSHCRQIALQFRSSRPDLINQQAAPWRLNSLCNNACRAVISMYLVNARLVKPGYLARLEGVKLNDEAGEVRHLAVKNPQPDVLSSRKEAVCELAGHKPDELPPLQNKALDLLLNTFPDWPAEGIAALWPLAGILNASMLTDAGLRETQANLRQQGDNLWSDLASYLRHRPKEAKDFDRHFCVAVARTYFSAGPRTKALDALNKDICHDRSELESATELVTMLWDGRILRNQDEHKGFWEAVKADCSQSLGFELPRLGSDDKKLADQVETALSVDRDAFLAVLGRQLAQTPLLKAAKNKRDAPTVSPAEGPGSPSTTSATRVAGTTSTITSTTITTAGKTLTLTHKNGKGKKGKNGKKGTRVPAVKIVQKPTAPEQLPAGRTIQISADQLKQRKGEVELLLAVQAALDKFDDDCISGKSALADLMAAVSGKPLEPVAIDMKTIRENMALAWKEEIASAVVRLNEALEEMGGIKTTEDIEGLLKRIKKDLQTVSAAEPAGFDAARFDAAGFDGEIARHRQRIKEQEEKDADSRLDVLIEQVREAADTDALARLEKTDVSAPRSPYAKASQAKKDELSEAIAKRRQDLTAEADENIEKACLRISFCYDVEYLILLQRVALTGAQTSREPDESQKSGQIREIVADLRVANDTLKSRFNTGLKQRIIDANRDVKSKKTEQDGVVKGLRPKQGYMPEGIAMSEGVVTIEGLNTWVWELARCVFLSNLSERQARDIRQDVVNALNLAASVLRNDEAGIAAKTLKGEVLPQTINRGEGIASQTGNLSQTIERMAADIIHLEKAMQGVQERAKGDLAKQYERISQAETEETLRGINKECLDDYLVATDDTRRAWEQRLADKAWKLRKAEEARADEEVRAAEEARLLKEARQRAEETRRVEEVRIAEEQARVAEEAQVAEEARLAEELRKAEEDRRVEEARQAEEAQQAQEAKKMSESLSASIASASDLAQLFGLRPQIEEFRLALPVQTPQVAMVAREVEQVFDERAKEFLVRECRNPRDGPRFTNEEVVGLAYELAKEGAVEARQTFSKGFLDAHFAGNLLTALGRKAKEILEANVNMLEGKGEEFSVTAGWDEGLTAEGGHPSLWFDISTERDIHLAMRLNSISSTTSGFLKNGLWLTDVDDELFWFVDVINPEGRFVDVIKPEEGQGYRYSEMRQLGKKLNALIEKMLESRGSSRDEQSIEFFIKETTLILQESGRSVTGASVEVSYPKEPPIARRALDRTVDGAGQSKEWPYSCPRLVWQVKETLMFLIFQSKAWRNGDIGFEVVKGLPQRQHRIRVYLPERSLGRQFPKKEICRYIRRWLRNAIEAALSRGEPTQISYKPAEPESGEFVFTYSDNLHKKAFDKLVTELDEFKDGLVVFDRVVGPTIEASRIIIRPAAETKVGVVRAAVREALPEVPAAARPTQAVPPVDVHKPPPPASVADGAREEVPPRTRVKDRRKEREAQRTGTMEREEEPEPNIKSPIRGPKGAGEAELSPELKERKSMLADTQTGLPYYGITLEDKLVLAIAMATLALQVPLTEELICAIAVEIGNRQKQGQHLRLVEIARLVRYAAQSLASDVSTGTQKREGYIPGVHDDLGGGGGEGGGAGTWVGFETVTSEQRARAAATGLGVTFTPAEPPGDADAAADGRSFTFTGWQEQGGTTTTFSGSESPAAVNIPQIPDFHRIINLQTPYDGLDSVKLMGFDPAERILLFGYYDSRQKRYTKIMAHDLRNSKGVLIPIAIQKVLCSAKYVPEQILFNPTGGNFYIRIPDKLGERIVAYSLYKNRKIGRSIKLKQGQSILSNWQDMAISLDGKYIYALFSPLIVTAEERIISFIRVFDLSTGEKIGEDIQVPYQIAPLAEMAGLDQDWAIGILANPDGQRLHLYFNRSCTFQTYDLIKKEWNGTGLRVEVPTPRLDAAVKSYAISADGQTIYLSACGPSALVPYSLESLQGGVPKPMPFVPGPLAVDSDGNLMVVMGYRNVREGLFIMDILYSGLPAAVPLSFLPPLGTSPSNGASRGEPGGADAAAGGGTSTFTGWPVQQGQAVQGSGVTTAPWPAAQGGSTTFNGGEPQTSPSAPAADETSAGGSVTGSSSEDTFHQVLQRQETNVRRQLDTANTTGTTGLTGNGANRSEIELQIAEQKIKLKKLKYEIMDTIRCTGILTVGTIGFLFCFCVPKLSSAMEFILTLTITTLVIRIFFEIFGLLEDALQNGKEKIIITRLERLRDKMTQEEGTLPPNDSVAVTINDGDISSAERLDVYRKYLINYIKQRTRLAPIVHDVTPDTKKMVIHIINPDPGRPGEFGYFIIELDTITRRYRTEPVTNIRYGLQPAKGGAEDFYNYQVNGYITIREANGYVGHFLKSLSQIGGLEKWIARATAGSGVTTTDTSANAASGTVAGGTADAMSRRAFLLSSLSLLAPFMAGKTQAGETKGIKFYSAVDLSPSIKDILVEDTIVVFDKQEGIGFTTGEFQFGYCIFCLVQAKKKNGEPVFVAGHLSPVRLITGDVTRKIRPDEMRRLIDNLAQIVRRETGREDIRFPVNVIFAGPSDGYPFANEAMNILAEKIGPIRSVEGLEVLSISIEAKVRDGKLQGKVMEGIDIFGFDTIYHFLLNEEGIVKQVKSKSGSYAGWAPFTAISLLALGALGVVEVVRARTRLKDSGQQPTFKNFLSALIEQIKTDFRNLYKGPSNDDDGDGDGDEGSANGAAAGDDVAFTPDKPPDDATAPGGRSFTFTGEKNKQGEILITAAVAAVAPDRRNTIMRCP